jgi:hypothetical protein
MVPGRRGQIGEEPSRLGQPHRHTAFEVEWIIDEDILEPLGALQPLEAAGQAEGGDPAGDVFESRRIGCAFGDQGPGVVPTENWGKCGGRT